MNTAHRTSGLTDEFQASSYVSHKDAQAQGMDFLVKRAVSEAQGAVTRLACGRVM